MKRLFIMLCILSSVTCAAQQKRWTKEPSSFLGIKFGVAIGEQMEECMAQARSDHPRTEAPCYNNDLVYAFQVYGVHGYKTLLVMEAAEKVGNICARFNRDDGSDIEYALIQKFGPPSSRGVSEMKTRMNVSLKKITLYWTGRDITIDYQSLASTIEEGEVCASNRAYRADVAAQVRRERQQREKQF